MSERGPGTRDLPLFQAHSATSREAWQNVKGRDSKRRQVYEYIRDRPHFGATDKEIQAALNMDGSTQRPRRVELVEAGLVWDSGRIRDRCTVWVATNGEEE